MKTTTNAAATTNAAVVNTSRLHSITLAHIVGDKITYSQTRATSHAAALQNAREETAAATVRAYYSPFGVSLPLAAIHVTAATLSGIARRGVGDVPRQQRQLAMARRTLHAMAEHGAKAVTIPQDIADIFQTAALALVNHTAPLATIEPHDIQAAYRAAMCAVQKAYRADSRGVQQAEAGKELPRLYGSPTMRTSTPRRAAPQAYKQAIATIKAAYIEQARDKAAAERVIDYWIANPESSTNDMAAALKLNQSNASRRKTDIRRIALDLFPNGIKAR